MTNHQIRAYLLSLQDLKYQSFGKKITPDAQHIIGVRMPLLKALAKEIAAEDCAAYLQQPYTQYHEERLLYGLVIGYTKANIEEVLAYIASWLPCVDNWAVCDSGIMNMKMLGKKQHQQRVWQFWTEHLASPQPFVLRAAIVALFAYFNNNEYAQQVAQIYAAVKNEHYYVKMALAWGTCELLIKHYDVGFDLLKYKKLDQWVHNKSIQKACESYRLSAEQKTELKNLKLET